MSAATYAAEEVSAAKDEFVRYLSDEEGTETSLVENREWDETTILIVALDTGNFYLSYVDPVVIGRRAFHSVDDMVGGAVASIRDVLCAAVDETIDAVSDIGKGLHLLNLVRRSSISSNFRKDQFLSYL